MDNPGFAAVVGGIFLCVGVHAMAEDEEDELPDMAFLEYLGMWDDSDEDWQLLAEDSAARNDERSDPVPEGEESPEKDDEG